MKIGLKAFTACCVIAACSALATAQTTVTFQQDVGGYTDTFDRRINLNDSEDGAGIDTTVSAFFIDGDPDDDSRSDYLIRFDNIIGPGGNQIPAGATILDATLTLTTTSSSTSSNAQSGESYNVYRLTQPFDSNSLLDGDFGDMDFLFTPFVDGVEPEQNEADFNVGTFDHDIGFSTMEVNQPYAANVTRAVQSWADGDANLGLAVMSDHTDNDDGWSVHTTGSSLAAARPLLSVTYTTDANTEVVELQNGLDGFAGTSDVFLDQTGSIDGSTVSEGFLDGFNANNGSPDLPYLVRFDLAGVPAASTIEKAELIIKTGVSSGASDSPGPAGAGYTVHQMLVPFTPASAYTDFAGDAAAMEGAGEIGPAAAIFEDIDEAELVSVDITSIVQNWLINGEDNNGLYLGALGTSNGWQIFSSGAIDQDLAPMLRITLTTGASGGTVTPDSFNVTTGEFVSGTVGDLADNDGSDVFVRRDSATVASVIAIDVKGTTPVQTPGSLSFTFDGAALARGTVNLRTSLFNYDSGQFEEVDSRNAPRGVDGTVTVTPGGDLSRFVEPGTGCVEARVRFQGNTPRASYAVFIDQLVWDIQP